MKKWLWLVALLLCAGAARGQMQIQLLNGYAAQGGQSVTVGGLPPTAATYMRTYPGATVAVYLTGTQTLATCYASASGGGVKSNPFTADPVTAYWSCWAVSGIYDVRFSGTGITTPWTTTGIVVGSGTNLGIGNGSTVQDGFVLSYPTHGNDVCWAINTSVTALATKSGTVDLRGFNGASLTCTVNAIMGSDSQQISVIWPAGSITVTSGVQLEYFSHNHMQGQGVWNNGTTFLQGNSALPLFVYGGSGQPIDLFWTGFQVSPQGGAYIPGTTAIDWSGVYHSVMMDVLAQADVALKIGGTANCACYNNFYSNWFGGLSAGIQRWGVNQYNNFFGNSVWSQAGTAVMDVINGYQLGGSNFQGFDVENTSLIGFWNGTSNVADYVYFEGGGTLSFNSWSHSTYYAIGSQVGDAAHHLQQVTAAGTSQNPGPPSWNDAGGTTTDGGVTWKDEGVGSWLPNTTYMAGRIVIDSNNRWEIATTNGISNSSAPSWATSDGQTTTDNTVTWQVETGTPNIIFNTNSSSNELQHAIASAFVLDDLSGYPWTQKVESPAVQNGTVGNYPYRVGAQQSLEIGGTPALGDNYSYLRLGLDPSGGGGIPQMSLQQNRYCAAQGYCGQAELHAGSFSGSIQSQGPLVVNQIPTPVLTSANFAVMPSGYCTTYPANCSSQTYYATFRIGAGSALATLTTTSTMPSAGTTITACTTRSASCYVVFTAPTTYTLYDQNSPGASYTEQYPLGTWDLAVGSSISTAKAVVEGVTLVNGQCADEGYLGCGQSSGTGQPTYSAWANYPTINTTGYTQFAGYTHTFTAPGSGLGNNDLQFQPVNSSYNGYYNFVPGSSGTYTYLTQCFALPPTSSNCYTNYANSVYLGIGSTGAALKVITQASGFGNGNTLEDGSHNMIVAGALTIQGATPTVGLGNIGLGVTTTAASSCGSLAGAAGCLTINIGGTAHYIPYY